MKCKNCKNTVPDGSIFCNWCGERLVKERKKKEEIKIPRPRQLKSGKWNIELRAEGQSITEDTAEKCEIKAKAIRAAFIAKKAQIDRSITLRDVLDKYIDAKRDKLSPSTIRGYCKIRNCYFDSVIDKPVNTVRDWQAVCNEAYLSHSPKTVKNAWSFTLTAFKYSGIPAPVVDLRPVPPHQKKWLDFEQIKTFVSAVYGQPCELVALLSLHGLRLSETRALSWDNGSIDLAANRLHIKASAVFDENESLVIKDGGKTAAAARSVPIMIPRLAELLNSHPQKTGRLFQGGLCSPYKQINHICRKAELPEVGVHGLRHSFASLGRHLGMSELEVADIGGWKDLQTMRKIYTHLARQDRLAAENKMASFYKELDK